MKAKNILMTILLAMGFISVKAHGYPPELVLVSQPVMMYDRNSVTVYYDVQNIGDYRYKGDIYIYLSPDDGYCFARQRIKIRPGSIKRIAVQIPAHSLNLALAYMVMPYYSMNGELYSFTSFEYFDPLTFNWHGPRTEVHYVTVLPPCPSHYMRPCEYRFFYDGYHPTMPLHNAPTPTRYHSDPMCHTYKYHSHNGGYPGMRPDRYVAPASNATVHPQRTPGSMSSRSEGGNSGASVNTNNSNGATTRPNANTNNSNGATTRPNANTGNSNSATTRPNANTGNSNSATTRPNANTGNNNSATTRPNTGNTRSNSSATARPSSSSNSKSQRNGRNSTSNSSTRSNTSNSGRSGR